MRQFLPALLAAGLALPAAPAAAGVVVADNGPAPLHGVATLQLEEMWRAGGADDEENFFGLIVWAEEGPDGLLYVLDEQMSQVNVYDDAGNLVRTLFHEGEGPGEVRRPRDVVILPDGSIGAVQEFPGKIVRVDASNTPLPSIEPRRGDAADGGFVAMTGAECRGGTFMIAGVQISLGERQGTQQRLLYLATVDDAGRISEPIIGRRVDWDFSHFVYDEDVNLPSFFWASTVGPDGRIYTAPDRSEYAVNVYAPDGALERVIRREYASRKRTAENMAWMNNLMEGAFRQLPGPYELKISDYDSDVHWLGRALQVDEQGNLWVLSSRGAQDNPPGVLATFDVFTPDGVFDRQVQVACEGDGGQDGVFLLGDDRVLVIRGFVDATATMFGGSPGGEDGAEAEPMQMVCYRIKG